MYLIKEGNDANRLLNAVITECSKFNNWNNARNILYKERPNSKNRFDDDDDGGAWEYRTNLRYITES